MATTTTERFAEVMATHAQIDPTQPVTCLAAEPAAQLLSAVPSASADLPEFVVRPNRRRVGYLGVRRMPATWSGFTGGVWALPIVAIRKHTWGHSTWSPPV